MHVRWTRVMDSDPLINLTICSPITVRVLHELLTVVERTFIILSQKMAAHNPHGSFSVFSGEFSFKTVFHSCFAVFADYFLSVVWARVRFQRPWVNSPPAERLELAQVASDEREVWEKSREGDKTSAAIAFIKCSWELVQPWVVLQGNSLMPWLHGIAG